MARYKLTLAYDGTDFWGSQRQAKSRTVQGELEKALRRMGWSGRSVLLAGRTDTGVHASGQVAAFDLEWTHGIDSLHKALNANLPFDVAVRQVEIAEPDFHPRFDATLRCYCYRLFCQKVRDPIRERMAWRVWPVFETSLLSKIAKAFMGQHDFAGYGSPIREESSTVRTVMHSKWKMVEGEWRYEIWADAFLYRMVRRLVYVQVSVAQGRSSIDTAVRVLENPQTKNEIPAGLAPAHGLTLVEVTY